jgi:nucleosome binding factor SPN SPT16 subunit
VSELINSFSSCDVPLSEGPVNLSWNAIMKTVNDDPYQFYEDGGWTFLTGGDVSDLDFDSGLEAS